MAELLLSLGQQPGHQGNPAEGSFSWKPLLVPQAQGLGSPARARVEKTGKDQTRGRWKLVEERAAGGVGEEQWAGPRRGGARRGGAAAHPGGV